MKTIGTQDATSMILPEDLESVDRTLYEPKRAELIARQVLAVPNLHPEWAQTVTHRKLQEAGLAKLMNQRGTDFPLIDVGMTQHAQPVHEMGLGYTLTRSELQEARATGMPLDATKAARLRRGFAEAENTLVFDGDADWGLDGLFNLTGATRTPVDNGTWSGVAEGSGSNIVADIRQIKRRLSSKDGFSVRKMVLHPDRFEDLEKTVSSNHDVTVIERIRALGWFPGGIFMSSTLPTDEFIVLDDSTDNIRLIIPQDVTRLDPWAQSPTTTLIAALERYSGIEAIFPGAVEIGTGI